ncbi:hypothetical protein VQ042_16540 [Aurantimonas sp. A2-1-M11]|uniref:hypothetical protein n=1 Tax=Aurantimonas sp. A2-1-M11 TaxID=3113712 RepID=UPI002F95253A
MEQGSKRRGQRITRWHGSALGYRSVPLQAPYCAANAAIRTFSDSLRSKIIHDGLDIRVVVCQLPAVNTPQFDWSLNKTPWRAQPVPPNCRAKCYSLPASGRGTGLRRSSGPK